MAQQGFDLILNNEILSLLFVFAQNLELQYVSKTMYQVSKQNSVRIDYLVHNFGADNVFAGIASAPPKSLKFAQQHDFLLLMVQRGIGLGLKKEWMLLKAVDNAWYDMLELLLHKFVFNRDPTFSNYTRFYTFAASGRDSVNTGAGAGAGYEYLTPYVNINFSGEKLFQLALKLQNYDILKLLLAAHKIQPTVPLASHVTVKLHNKIDLSKIAESTVKGIIISNNTRIIDLLVSNGMDFRSYTSTLIEACKTGNLDAIKFLLQSGVDLFNPNISVLSTACRYGHFDVVKHALDMGLDVDATEVNAFNENPIDMACESGNLDVVKLLISRGATHNVHNNQIFMNMVHYGSIEIVEYLVEIGTDIHFWNEEALIRACYLGRLDIVKCLVNNGANIHARDDQGLYEACFSRRLNVIEYLIRKGANVNSRKSRALVIACSSGLLESVELLVANGAKFYNQQGKALVQACSNNRPVIVNYLVENGADIHYRSDKALIDACCNRNLEIVKTLVNKGSNVKARFSEALFKACRFKRDHIIDYLIERGADRSVKANFELIKACSAGKLSAVQWFIANGANAGIKVDVNVQGGRPLISACAHGHYDIAVYLVSVGAKPEMQGYTAFTFSCSRGDLRTAQFLVENGGASIVAKSKSKTSKALNKACRIGHSEIVKLLVANGTHLSGQLRGQALLEACHKGRLEIVQFLVESGFVDINAKDGAAMVAACIRGDIELIHYLVSNGADVNVQNGKPLLAATKRGKFEVVEYLLRNGADLWAQEGKAFVFAARSGLINLVKLLCNSCKHRHNHNKTCDHFSREEIIKKSFNAALISACRCKKLDIVKYLVSKGATITDITVAALCSKPPHRQSESESDEVLEFLLSNPHVVMSTTRSSIYE